MSIRKDGEFMDVLSLPLPIIAHILETLSHINYNVHQRNICCMDHWTIHALIVQIAWNSQSVNHAGETPRPSFFHSTSHSLVLIHIIQTLLWKPLNSGRLIIAASKKFKPCHHRNTYNCYTDVTYMYKSLSSKETCVVSVENINAFIGLQCQ
jgi:hypothetical protein